ncbi:MAG: hypothetical protein WBI14_10105 [Anaerolineaceae bacterium]
MTLHFDERTLAVLEQVRVCRKEGQEVYLVGGAVRDAILSKPIKDLDFVSNIGSMTLARCVQRLLKGEGYTLDDERHSARIILNRGKETELILDFVVFSGEDLSEDLKKRDFTINAMAVDLEKLDELIDPLDGLKSLSDKKLRVADEDSIRSDALRAIRALRLSRSLNFDIEQETVKKIRESATGLEKVAGERVRDEVFKLFSLPDPAGSIEQLEALGLLPYVFPDLDQLRIFPRIDPHVHDLFHHTLALVNHSEDLLSYIVAGEISENPYLRHACEQLGPWRKQLAEHFRMPIQTERSRVALFYLAEVYHDVGKPITMKTDAGGSVHFYQHPLQADSSLAKVASRLALSNTELDYLSKLVRNHMRIHTLTSASEITDRAIYRYFQELGAFGVDLAILSMADTLAAKEETLEPMDWQVEVEAGVGMIRAWFERKKEVVDPHKLMDGFELQEVFGLQPGQILGQLLTAIREAQAAGEVHTKDEVFAFARRYLNQK